MLCPAQFRDMSMGQYLQLQGYSQGFINNYVVPMCAAVWSVPKAQVRMCVYTCVCMFVQGGVPC